MRDMDMVEQIVNEILEGRRLTRADDLSFLFESDFEQLQAGANRIREELCGNHVDLCTIINGRSGRCSANCKFCAQSYHYHTGAEEYEILETDEFVRTCRHHEEMGDTSLFYCDSGTHARRKGFRMGAESIPKDG